MLRIEVQLQDPCISVQALGYFQSDKFQAKEAETMLVLEQSHGMLETDYDSTKSEKYLQFMCHALPMAWTIVQFGPDYHSGWF